MAGVGYAWILNPFAVLRAAVPNIWLTYRLFLIALFIALLKTRSVSICVVKVALRMLTYTYVRSASVLTFPSIYLTYRVFLITLCGSLLKTRSEAIDTQCKVIAEEVNMHHKTIRLILCGILCNQGIALEETTQSRPSQSRSAESTIEKRPHRLASLKAKLSNRYVLALCSVAAVIGFATLRQFLTKSDTRPPNDLLDPGAHVVIEEPVLLSPMGVSSNSEDEELNKSEEHNGEDVNVSLEPVVIEERASLSLVEVSSNSGDEGLNSIEESDQENDVVPPGYTLEETLYDEYLMHTQSTPPSDQEYNNYLYTIHNPRPLPQLPDALKHFTASHLSQITFLPKVDQLVPSHNMQWEVKLGEKLILELIDRDQLTDLFISPAMIKVLFGEQIAEWSGYVPPRGWVDLPGDDLSSPSRLQHLNIFINFGSNHPVRSQLGFQIEALIAKQIRENPTWLNTQGSNWKQSYLWFVKWPLAAYFGLDLIHTPVRYYLEGEMTCGHESLKNLAQKYGDSLTTANNFDFKNTGFKNYLEVIKTLMPEIGIVGHSF
jgi:hypothetical protein